MKRRVPFFVRKSFLFCCLVLVLFNLCIVFRYSLAAAGLRTTLARTFGEAVQYDTIQPSHKSIALRGLHIESEAYHLIVDDARITIAFTKFLSHPRAIFSLFKGKAESVLTAMQQAGIALSVDSGVLQTEGERYYFRLASNQKGDTSAQLQLSLDPGLIDHPFFIGAIQLADEHTIVQGHFEAIAVRRLLPLANFLIPKSFPSDALAEGVLEGEASILLDANNSLSQLSTRLFLNQFSLVSEEKSFALRFDAFHGDLNYPSGAQEAGLPAWRKGVGILQIQNGYFQLGNYIQVANVMANLGIDPREEPTIQVIGEIIADDETLDLTIDGSPKQFAIQSDLIHLSLQIDNRKGVTCESVLSVSYPEKNTLVVELEAQQLLPHQVTMLKESLTKSFPRLDNWGIKQGTFSGKMVALFEQGVLSRLELHDVVGQEVVLQGQSNDQIYLPHILAEGRLYGWDPSPLGELMIDADLPLSHLLGWPSSTLRTAYAAFRPSDLAHLNLQMQYRDGNVETRGAVGCLEIGEAIQFGWMSPAAFPDRFSEITDGWIRSEKLTHMFYGPFIAQYAEDLEVYGDIDLLATFDGKDLELALQVDNFLSNHPLFDLKMENIGQKGMSSGRMRLTFTPDTGELKGEIPLLAARGYERQNGLVLEQLNGSLTFSYRSTEQNLHAKISSGNLSFDQKHLVHDLQGEILLDKGVILIKEFDSILALEQDVDVHLSFETFAMVQDRCKGKGKLSFGSDTLVDFSLAKDADWQLDLHSRADFFQTDMQIFLDWDRVTNTFAFRGEAEKIESLGRIIGNITFRGEKRGDIVSLEQFETANMIGSARCQINESGFTLNEFNIRKPAMQTVIKGEIIVDTPTQECGLALRCMLEGTAEIFAPITTQIITEKPFPFVFSTKTGMIISDLALQLGDSSLHIDHAEYLLSERKFDFRKTSFILSQEMQEALSDVQLFPALISDFQFSHPLCGVLGGSIHQGLSQIQGTLLEGAPWHKGKDLQFTVKADQGLNDTTKCVLTLLEGGEVEGLTFTGSMDEQGFNLQKVSGRLGRLNTQMEQYEGSLHGHVELDFSLFDQLFDLPINANLSRWRVGKGYRLEGIFTTGSRLSSWGFHGKIFGETFHCAGCEFRSLEADLQIAPELITIENLDVTDDAGKLWIETGYLTKTESDEDWSLSIPRLEVRSFQPGSLNKQAGMQPQELPFVIKSATLTNVEGRVNDLYSLTADGELRFTAIREGRDLSAPVNLYEGGFHKLGLDNGLFIPVAGTMGIRIADGACYINALDDVVSGGRRSEFYLPKRGNAGYLDFSGNLYIDCQVRQVVVPSIRRPLLLQVRGTWNHPELTVR